MRIALNIKNGAKTTGFKKNDALIFDGENWYSTNYSELEARVTAAIEAYDKKYQEILEKLLKFQEEYESNNAKLIPILEELLRKEN